jgi:hypothetical protein
MSDERWNQLRLGVLAHDPPLQQAYQAYLEAVVRLPNVELGTSEGLPAVRVGGKLLSRLRINSDRALALRYEIAEREALLTQAPDAFFVPDLYRNYPLVLVRLEKVERERLAEIAERAYRALVASE